MNEEFNGFSFLYILNAMILLILPNIIEIFLKHDHGPYNQVFALLQESTLFVLKSVDFSLKNRFYFVVLLQIEFLIPKIFFIFFIIISFINSIRNQAKFCNQCLVLTFLSSKVLG